MEHTKLVEGTEVGDGTIAGESEVDDTEATIVEEHRVDNMGVTAEIGESSVLQILESSVLQTGEISVSLHPAEEPPELPP